MNRTIAFILCAAFAGPATAAEPAHETLLINSYKSRVTRWGAFVPGIGYLPTEIGPQGERILKKGTFFPEIPPAADGYRYLPLEEIPFTADNPEPAQITRYAQAGPLAIVLDGAGEVAGAVAYSGAGPVHKGYLGVGLSNAAKAAVRKALAPPPPEKRSAKIPQFFYDTGASAKPAASALPPQSAAPPEPPPLPEFPETPSKLEPTAPPDPVEADVESLLSAPETVIVTTPDRRKVQAKLTPWGAHVPGVGYYSVIDGKPADVPLFPDIGAAPAGFEHIPLERLHFTKNNPMPPTLAGLAEQEPIAVVRNTTSGEITGATGWNINYRLPQAERALIAAAAPALPPPPEAQPAAEPLTQIQEEPPAPEQPALPKLGDTIEIPGPDGKPVQAVLTRWGAHVPGTGYYPVQNGKPLPGKPLPEVPEAPTGFEHISVEKLQFSKNNPMPTRLLEVAAHAPVMVVLDKKSGEIVGLNTVELSYVLSTEDKKSIRAALKP